MMKPHPFWAKADNNNLKALFSPWEMDAEGVVTAATTDSDYISNSADESTLCLGWDLIPPGHTSLAHVRAQRLCVRVG